MLSEPTPRKDLSGHKGCSFDRPCLEGAGRLKGLFDCQLLLITSPGADGEGPCRLKDD